LSVQRVAAFCAKGTFWLVWGAALAADMIRNYEGRASAGHRLSGFLHSHGPLVAAKSHIALSEGMKDFDEEIYNQWRSRSVFRKCIVKSLYEKIVGQKSKVVYFDVYA
jgi:hypothetical protein